MAAKNKTSLCLHQTNASHIHKTLNYISENFHEFENFVCDIFKKKLYTMKICLRNIYLLYNLENVRDFKEKIL